MTRSAGELRDIAEIFALHEARLDALAAEIVLGNEKFAEHDRALGKFHQELETVRNELTLLRDAMNDAWKRCLDNVDAALRRARIDADTQ